MPSVAAVILSKLLPILCLTWKVGIIVLASWVIVIMKWDKALYSVKSLEKQIHDRVRCATDLLGETRWKIEGKKPEKVRGSSDVSAGLTSMKDTGKDAVPRRFGRKGARGACWRRLTTQ